jgi:hypothetical protein
MTIAPGIFETNMTAVMNEAAKVFQWWVNASSDTKDG